MDIQNTGEGSAPDEFLPGPPTLHPSMLDFGYVPLGSQRTLEQIIANTTKRPMIWLADAHESQWLSVAPDHGVLQPGEQQSTRVTADTRSLEPGEHSATLTFSSEGDETSMSEYTTGKIIVEEPVLQPLEAGLDFGFLPPDSTLQSGLLITNPNNLPLDWHILIGTLVREKLEHPERPRIKLERTERPGSKEDYPLVEEQISLSQTEGQLTASGSHTVYVTVDSTNLEPGYSYTTNLTLISNTTNLALISNTAQSSVNVPVTFYVNETPGNDGGPRAPHDLSQNINFTIHSGQASAHTLSFTNAESQKVNWELTSGAKWLLPKHLNGTAAPNGPVSINLTATKVGAGNYKAGLNLTLTWADGTAGITEIKPWIHVFLTVQ